MSGRRPTTRPGLAIALSATLLVATLGEGGGSAIGLAAWHAVLGACVVGVLLAGRRSAPTARFGAAPGVATPLALFTLLALAGTLRVPYVFAAWLVMLEIAAGLAAFALAAGCGPDLIRVASWPLRGAAAVHGVTIVAQRVWGGELRPASSFLNPNHAGAWLVVATLVGLGALPEQRRSRAVALAAAIASTAGVLVVGSRGAFLALVCGLIVLGASAWPRLARRTRVAAVVGALLIVAALGVALNARSRQADPFRYQRVRIWSASSAIAVDNPWWGSGPGQLAVTALRYQFPDDDGLLRHDRRFSVTHSDLLRLPAEFGLPASLAMLLALVAISSRIVSRRLRGELGHGADGAIAALVAIAAQATVDNPSRWSSVALCGAMLAGALVARPVASTACAARWPRSLRWALASGVVALLLAGDVAPTVGVRWHGSLPRGWLEAGQLEQLRRAARINRLHPEPWRRLAEHELSVAGGMDLGGYARAREAAETALRRQPNDPRYVRTLARVEAEACRRLVLDEQTRDRARRAYRRATELAPGDAVLWLELAALWLDTGEPSRAVAAARSALALEPDSVVPRLVLAEALLNGGLPQSHARARRLVEEAQTLWVGAESEARSGAYAAALLVPDQRLLTRLASVLDERPVHVPAGAAETPAP